jgi:hypothetical protein
MKKIYKFTVISLLGLLTYAKSNAQCPYPTPVVNVVNGVICNGSPAILSVPDIYDAYQWYWGGVPVPVAANDYGYWAVVQGNYSLEVVLNGCTTLTAPVFVSAPLIPPLNFADTLYSCTNQLTVQLDTILYDSYLWSTGQNTSSLTFTQDGWIGVGVGNTALSCGVADTFWVSLNKPSPTVSITTIGNNPFCIDSSVTFESSNPTGNLWSNGATTSSIVVNTPGLYTVTVENGFGCTATASVQANDTVCAPSSQLSSNFCPNYNLVQTSALICVPFPGATQYEWEFSQNGNVYATKFSLSNYTVLHGSGPQITFGNIYQVRVRPFVAGQWGVFGNVCEIGLVPQPTVNTVPLTQLRSQDCGRLNYRINNNNRIIGNAVYQAAAYEFQFSDANTNTVIATKIVQNHPICYLNTVTPNLPFPAQYNVRVRVFYGGIWGNYGNACLIGIIGLNKEEAETEEEIIETNLDESYFLEVGTYPNPFDNNAILAIASSENEKMNVIVYDITGKIVDEFIAAANNNTSFGEAYKQGLYFLKITTSNGYEKNIKVLKN